MAKKKTETPRPQDIGTKAAPFIERLENMVAAKAEYMEGYKTDVEEIYDEAEEMGIAKKALKRTMRLRRLNESIAGLKDKLDMDEAAQFSALADAFGGTPFGEFAQQAAEFLHRTEGVEFKKSTDFDPDPIDDFAR